MMKIVRCEKCGKIAGIIQDSACPTKCCGEPMAVLEANTSDGALEKHVPVVEIDGSLVTVTVGEALHPMLDAHYIQWILLETNKGMSRRPLNPGDAPKAEFALTEGEEVIAAYEYCNLHGFWKKEL